jgi:hypothetical protein
MPGIVNAAEDRQREQDQAHEQHDPYQERYEVDAETRIHLRPLILRQIGAARRESRFAAIRQAG